MKDLVWFFSIATCTKLLIAPSYHSTDFEVHRHWLALTSSLPISRWYSDESSPWTLDYPPLFAYFERLLSIPASLADPTIVHLTLGAGYSAPSAVLFQRATVSASDLALLIGTHLLTRRKPGPTGRNVLLSLVIWSPALLIVDHMHFQYNGYLLGILLISLGFLAQGSDLAGGFAFAVLICSKHLFMVAAPVYFVYLLRHYCGNGGFARGFLRFMMMGGAVGGFCCGFWAVLVPWTGIIRHDLSAQCYAYGEWKTSGCKYNLKFSNLCCNYNGLVAHQLEFTFCYLQHVVIHME